MQVRKIGVTCAMALLFSGAIAGCNKTTNEKPVEATAGATVTASPAPAQGQQLTQAQQAAAEMDKARQKK